MMMLFVLIYRMFDTGETHENLVEDMRDRLLAAHFIQCEAYIYIFENDVFFLYIPEVASPNDV